MKVDDGRRPERREAENRRHAEARDKAEGEKSRFSKMMERRQSAGRKTPGGDNRGDERARELREGQVQRRGRDDDARRLNRAGPSGGQSAEKGRKADKKPEAFQGGAQQSREVSLMDSEAREVAQPGGYEPEIGDPTNGIEEVRERTTGARAASHSAAAQSSDPPMTQVSQAIVEAVRVGHDAEKRQVVFVDVTVPGRGDVRIRLRRDGGGGMQVRMRADNDALARTLQRGVGELREEGKRNDIQFTSIRVVR